MKLTVFRPETVEFQALDIEFVKKPGKGLGLSLMARKNGKGVYISDVVRIFYLSLILFEILILIVKLLLNNVQKNIFVFYLA